MGMTRLIPCLAIICLALLCCKEEKWTLVKEGASAKVFVDRRSIEHVSANTVRAWVKFEFTQPEEGGQKAAKRMDSYEEFDCKAKTRRTLQVKFYYTDGTEESSSEPGAVDLVEPGSYAEVELGYLCK